MQLACGEPSRAKTLSAGTRGRSIRILHFETAFLQSVHVIKFAAGDVKGALRINDHADARGFDKNVTVRRSLLQVHLVLKPGTATADDSHAQYPVGPALLRQERADFLRRAESRLAPDEARP